MPAREFYSAFSAAEVSTVSLTEWASVGSLSFTPQAGVAYVVFWSFEATKTNITNTSLQFRVAVDGVAVDQASVRARNANDYPQFFGFIGVSGDGIAKTVSLDIINLQAPYAVVGRNASLVALALGANDFYAESLLRTETNSSTLAPLCEINTAAAAGEYLVLGMSSTDNNNTTAPTYAGLNVNGAASETYTVGHANLADVRPLAGMWPRTLAADGSLVARWMGRSHSNGGVCGWRSNRILALRLEDFDGARTAVSTANSDGVETEWTEALSLGHDVRPTPHLVLSSYQLGCNSTNAFIQSRLTEDGNELGASTFRSYAVSFERLTQQGLVRLHEFEAGGPRRWSLERKGDGAATGRLAAGATLAVLDLGDASQNLAGAAGAFLTVRNSAALSAKRRFAADQRALHWASLDGSLGRGFRMPLSLELVPIAGQAAKLRRGLRLAAVVKADGLSGTAVNLSRTIAGARLRAEAETLLSGEGPCVLRAGRQLLGGDESFAWARLDGRLGMGMRITSIQATFTVESAGGTEWGWTHIFKPPAVAFASYGAVAALKYSGQQFWQVIAPAAAAWSPQPPIQETWAPSPITPETWN